jgi:hypothetical protein
MKWAYDKYVFFRKFIFHSSNVFSMYLPFSLFFFFNSLMHRFNDLSLLSLTSGFVQHFSYVGLPAFFYNMDDFYFISFFDNFFSNYFLVKDSFFFDFVITSRFTVFEKELQFGDFFYSNNLTSQ